MDNSGEAIETLQTLMALCREAAAEHGGDYAAAWASLRTRMLALPKEQREEIGLVLKDILRFEPPPTRGSQ
ncbi:hypothetical protein [Methylorubrum sp. SB2]|jgi:hypothetical protein|uniref:hypothetical protein n=1 Tax=Methylorubrum subtropicum TaxID=3138812 RepID=UPI00313D09DE